MALDKSDRDYVAVSNETFELLRNLWRSCSSPELRESIKQVAINVETIAGDRDYLESLCNDNDQAEWRETILSY